MSPRTAAKKRAPKHGAGNPIWNRAYVTASVTQNFKPDEFAKTPPVTLSASPQVGSKSADRIGIDLAQNPYGSKRFRLHVEGDFGRDFDQLVTLEQLYSFEEAVRAVFCAAREEGILPAAR